MLSLLKYVSFWTYYLKFKNIKNLLTKAQFFLLLSTVKKVCLPFLLLGFKKKNLKAELKHCKRD